MQKLSKNQAIKLAGGQRPKNRPYRYKPGNFVLTANFRDSSIDQTHVEMIGHLIKSLTQKQIAHALGVSIGTVQKLCRIHAARNYQP